MVYFMQSFHRLIFKKNTFLFYSLTSQANIITDKDVIGSQLVTQGYELSYFTPGNLLWLYFLPHSVSKQLFAYQSFALS